MNRSLLYIGGGIIVLLMALWAVWIIFFAGTPNTNPRTNSSFGTSNNRTTVGTTNDQNNQPAPLSTTGAVSTQKIFKISDGPVAGAALIDISRPTTTVARYVMADSGHIFDYTLDSPGSTQRPISNTTIPGIVKVYWSEGNQGALLQYLDQGVIKTVHFSFSNATTSVLAKVQFLQNNVVSLAVSPQGTQVAFLIKTSVGVDGYTASTDGASVKKLFSLPLSQVSIIWPSTQTLLVANAPAAGVSSGVFAVDVKSGAVAPLLFANELTATADKTFNYLVYQTNTGYFSTYVHNIKTNRDTTLPFSPFPERCLWGIATTTQLYCATPLSYVDTSYLDQWHLGVANTATAIVAYDVTTGAAATVANPGGSDGGDPSDIASFTLSPDGHYLLFVRRGDRSLWGVRLSQ